MVLNIQPQSSNMYKTQTSSCSILCSDLRAYSVCDDPKQAFSVFNNLRAQGIALDQFSFTTILKACTRDLAFKTGQGMHGIVVRSGHLIFINVKNILLHFYSVCCRIDDARKLFEEFPQENDLVSWNALMGAYLRASQPSEAIELFRQMLTCGLRVSAVTLLTMFSAFADFGDLHGGSIHAHSIKIGFSSKVNVVTALIEMYAKTGDIDSGRRVFDGVIEKDVIIWNCMIDKYAKAGLLEQAMALLQIMKLEGVKPNSSTLAGLLGACAACKH